VVGTARSDAIMMNRREARGRAERSARRPRERQRQGLDI